MAVLLLAGTQCRFCFTHAKSVSINQRFYCQLTMTQTFLCRFICKLIFLAVYCLDLLQCQISQRRFFLILWQCFHGFVKAVSCVCPAAGNLQVFTFLFDGMIDLIAICYTDSLERKYVSSVPCLFKKHAAHQGGTFYFFFLVRNPSGNSFDHGKSRFRSSGFGKGPILRSSSNT